MQNLDKNVLKQLSSELALLCSDMLELESSFLKSPVAVHEAHRRSARNLAHYLALRRRDIRGLQSHLALLGLSSLGRTESHVLDAVQTVHRVLNVLLGSNSALPSPAEPAVELSEGTQLLEANTNALLGSYAFFRWRVACSYSPMLKYSPPKARCAIAKFGSISTA